MNGIVLALGVVPTLVSADSARKSNAIDALFNQSSGSHGSAVPTSDVKSDDGSEKILIIVLVVVLLVLVLCSSLLFLLFFLARSKARSEKMTTRDYIRQRSFTAMRHARKSIHGRFRRTLPGSRATEFDDECISIAPTRAPRPIVNVPLPTGKQYHYFVSHKKWHSLLYNQPEQAAMAIHDFMKDKGFNGFFHVDNLKEISQEEVVKCCKQSCTMVIYLHDETFNSEWCRLEWEVAQKNEIPLLVVADCEHCSKQDMLNQVQEPYTFLLQNEWVDYIGAHRQLAWTSIVEWVDVQVQGQLAGPLNDLPGRPSTH